MATTTLGIALTLVANGVALILGLPGLIFAPSMEVFVSTIIGVITDVAVIVRCLWRDRCPVAQKATTFED